MWPGARPTSVPSGILIHLAVWPFGHNRHGPKSKGLCPFLGGVGFPSNTISPTGLPSHQVKWHLDPSSRLATTEMYQKVRGALVPPFFRGEGSWRRGVVASVVRRMNEVTVRRARLVLGWVTVFGRVYHHGM